VPQRRIVLASSPFEDPFVASIALVLGVARRKRFRVALIVGFALPFHGVQRATGDVDFLVDTRGSNDLHEALLAAGARCLHRSADAANYAPAASRLAPLDFIYARRERARAMLGRTTRRLLRGARLRVPVVDAEALIGLKLQALANEPRRFQDEADIGAPVAARGDALDVDVLRDYYRLFARERDLDRLLKRTKERQPPGVKRPKQPIVGDGGASSSRRTTARSRRVSRVPPPDSGGLR
jgi:hypothetical protein